MPVVLKSGVTAGRALTYNSAQRLARMRTHPNTNPRDLAAEETILKQAKKEAQRTDQRIDDL